ncbi:efflux transporter outer membrane subunit [Stenotrophomonas sp.]|uniref:efflux transporter outer membrane subunit n=1 Tax=Stenotrophomonas sp. TaxID=69392 RepID=UPI0028ADFB39|nr:efflux transporter outer membrane subunit [Stenotrophomonas sp.]
MSSFLPRGVFLMPALLAGVLGGCAVGPDFVRPDSLAPDDWSQWRDGDALLQPALDGAALQPQWWTQLSDPVLDQLQRDALSASPDLRTAALHFAQARAQRSTVAAQRGVTASVSGSAARQRQSENGAGTRMLDILSSDSSTLKQLLAEPFNLYQAGFDASWELDLWGRVRRSVEAADAGVAQQAALLDLARQSVTSEVARNYVQLRGTQQQIALAREDIGALEERLQLLQARVDGGLDDHLDLDRQQADVAAIRARLPLLLAEEAAAGNQLALLLGQRPGALRQRLAAVPAADDNLPDLALGLPSELAKRRPDIRAAEARLHQATASIGVAKADLYPSIRLGAKFGYESYLSGEFSDWGSRTWSVGPVLNLPLFDHGRRKSVVQLRQLEQQEAAVTYQKTVLQAWQEIDNALNAYAAAQHQRAQLRVREQATLDAYRIAQARSDAGLIDFLSVLDARRSYLQTRRELVDGDAALRTQFIALNKALGNGPLIGNDPMTSR